MSQCLTGQKLVLFPLLSRANEKKAHPSRETSVSTSHLHTPVLVFGGGGGVGGEILLSNSFTWKGSFWFIFPVSVLPSLPPSHNPAWRQPRPNASTYRIKLSDLCVAESGGRGPRVHPITNSNEVENSPALETAEGSSPITQPSPG